MSESQSSVPEDELVDATVWQPTPEAHAAALQALTRLRQDLDGQYQNATIATLLYAKRGRTREDKFRRLNMDTVLSEELKSEFNTSLRRVTNEAVADREALSPFQFADHAEGTLIYMPLEAFPPVQARVEDVPSDLWEPFFNPNEDFLKNLKAVYTSICFETERRLIIGQCRSQNRLINKGIGAIFNDQLFTKVDLSKVLGFDSDIDFIVWDGFLFIKSLEKFETLFGFREATSQTARQAFEAIVAALPIEDHESVLEMLTGRARHLRKLAKISQIDYLDTLEAKNIAAQIEEHQLPMRLEVSDGKMKIILDDPNDANAGMELLRLIDDDLWRSALTDRRYAARAKDRRQ